ncbi:MAG: hypothetical protein GY786_17645 [Proteobacteria bacterium]|nr:hypothetical protein [Pseudomonadota bacterium]
MKTKKIFVIFSGMAFILMILAVLNLPEIHFEKSKITPPKKPASIPASAFWIGGIDGGNFIIVKRNKNKKKSFFAEIYNDHSGDVEFEGILEYSGDEEISNKLNDRSIYLGWDGNKLHLVSGAFMRVFGQK